MKIHDVAQGTDAWLKLRMGICTASEFSSLMTDNLAPRKPDSEMVNTYLCKKLSEKWRGEPLVSFHGGAMEQGSILEGEAIPWYANDLSDADHLVTIRRVGFITTDDGRIGCSPDGMITDTLGLECKCPEAHTHVKYLLDGELPKAYAAQVQGSMLVTNAPAWRFLSYCRGFPALVLTVERDDKAIAALDEALADFNNRLDLGWARLCEINGGPPDPREMRTGGAEFSEVEWDKMTGGQPATPLTPEEVAAKLDAAERTMNAKEI